MYLEHSLCLTKQVITVSVLCVRVWAFVYVYVCVGVPLVWGFVFFCAIKAFFRLIAALSRVLIVSYRNIHARTLTHTRKQSHIIITALNTPKRSKEGSRESCICVCYYYVLCTVCVFTVLGKGFRHLTCSRNTITEQLIRFFLQHDGDDKHGNRRATSSGTPPQ